jgi:hypothetical protein
MKNVLRISAFVVLGLASLAPRTGHAANASASASANIIQAIAISKTADMNFGSIVPGSSAATVVLGTNGAVTSTLTTTGSRAAAAFNVTGGANTAYSITLPTSVSLSNGAQTMTVNNFTSSIGTSGTIAAGGSQAFNVGATLNVGANQTSGAYTGNFTVTVDYN